MALIGSASQRSIKEDAPIVIWVCQRHRFKFLKFMVSVIIGLFHEHCLIILDDTGEPKANGDEHIHRRDAFNGWKIQTTLMDLTLIWCDFFPRHDDAFLGEAPV